MSWLRIDDGFATNAKIAALTDRELRVWLRVLCHCARHDDPTVDEIVVKEVPGLTPKLMSKWVALSLLDRSGNAYEIHHWIEYQPKDKTGAERQATYRARRLELAETDESDPLRDRYGTVTETVTPDRYENVTLACAPARPDPSRPVQEDLNQVQNPSFLPTSQVHVEKEGRHLKTEAEQISEQELGNGIPAIPTPQGIPF